MTKKLIFLVLALMSSAHAGSISKAVASLPDVPAPPQGETDWVAQSMRMNGLPMTIQTLVSRSVPGDVIHFYESWAKRSGAQTRQWHTRDSQVLSIRAASYLVTIELQRVVDGSQGTIVTSSPPEKERLTAATAFAYPSSWRVANLQQYEDDGKETEHITFTSAQAAMTEAQAVLKMFAANGWTVISKRSSGVNDFLVELQRNAELARIVITNDADRRANTFITVLWSKG